MHVLVLDNGSTDGSLELLRDSFPGVHCIQLSRNLGYAGAANVAVRESGSSYLLLLNPDVVLTSTFVASLVVFAQAHPEAGSVTGKLLRFTRGNGDPVIDSTGHVLFRNRWAVNRGEGEIDRGQYETAAEVFGVSGAAGLYRRAMLEDIQVEGEVFPESFFLYLEDVDVDWRARLRGWKAYYVPSAVGYHERGYKGGTRTLDATVLRHSLKNRYLMMVRNDTPGDVLRDAGPILLMEVLRFLDFALRAPRALAGYVGALRSLRVALRQRREIQRRVLTPGSEIRRWLRRYPYRRELWERARLLLARSA